MAEKFDLSVKLGIVGGGQLGKMLTLAANNWDLNTSIIDPNPDCPAAHTCRSFFQGDLTDYETIYAFGQQVDILTIEIENVNTKALQKLKEEGKTVIPDPEIIAMIQDKGLQKTMFKENNIPTSAFQLFEDQNALHQAIQAEDLTLPIVQKTRVGGYDGQGVKVVRTAEDATALLPGPCLAEHMVDIDKEVSVVVARNAKGEVRSFPMVEMVCNQEANLVSHQTCPANVSVVLEKEGYALAEKIVSTLNFVGLLAVEMFIDKDGKLWVNELAPRPHNSGHHSIESIYTSQYEQLLRAILGLPLGSTQIIRPSVMINLLGHPEFKGPVVYEGLQECMAIEGAYFHLYGKKETKPFRKMGHATVMDEQLEDALNKAQIIQKTLTIKS